MAVPLKPVAVMRKPPRAVQKTVRKVGIVGSHTQSLEVCPWEDPSWELWGHACSRFCFKREMDRYFELHSRARWEHPTKQNNGYVTWLKNTLVPIYMQAKYPEIPASVRYPKERILMEYGQPRPYFTNHVAWMIALAMSEGVTTIGLFGINYGHDTEYQRQRGCAEYWLGRAHASGIHLVIPEACTLLAEPLPLYGYDSHDSTGALRDEYKQRPPKPTDDIVPVKPGEKPQLVAPPDWLRAVAGEDDLLRPVPALGPTDFSESVKPGNGSAPR